MDLLVWRYSRIQLYLSNRALLPPIDEYQESLNNAVKRATTSQQAKLRELLEKYLRQKVCG